MVIENMHSESKTGEPNQNINKRKEWVDLIRALAMFFVIFGHIIGWVPAYFVYTSPIKIPLFFVITGYVFNYERKSTVDFLKNLFFKLIIPWLVLSIPFTFLKLSTGNLSDVLKEIKYILTGVTIWYMPCCIVAEIIWFFINKYGKSKFQIIFSALVIFGLGIYTGYMDVLNVAMINRAMVVQFFILLGYLYKVEEKKIDNIGWVFIIALVSIYIAMGIISLIIWPNTCLDVHVNRYYNYPFCFAMITLGCFLVFIIFQKLFTENNISLPHILIFLGQNTLVYYLLHNQNLRLITFVFQKMNLQMSSWMLIIIELVLTYLLCGIEAAAINRFIPQILGRKSKRQKHNKDTI